MQGVGRKSVPVPDLAGMCHTHARSCQKVAHCHAHDNQLHPRLKNSPLHLVPLPSHLLQITEITLASPLRTPYVIQHHLASPQPNLEHLKTSPKRIQPHATNLAISPACRRLAPQYSPSGKLAKVPSIVTSLYLVPFHLCTLLFLFSASHCPGRSRVVP